jgi:hypothetical protein
MAVHQQIKRDPDRGRWAAMINALLTEPTHTAAARKAGVGEATLRRHLRKPAFVSLLRNARRQSIDAAVGRLVASSTAAVQTLERLLTCEIPSVELRAAATILEMGVRTTTHDELLTRLEEVEREAAETRNKDASK